MSADLDTLNDAQLSEVFAVEAAGWVKSDHSGWWFRRGVCMHKRCVEFATSADAVLPFLEKHPVALWKRQDAPGWGCCHGQAHQNQIWSNAPTFARAACIALILAKRAENGGAK